MEDARRWPASAFRAGDRAEREPYAREHHPLRRRTRALFAAKLIDRLKRAIDVHDARPGHNYVQRVLNRRPKKGEGPHRLRTAGEWRDPPRVSQRPWVQTRDDLEALSVGGEGRVVLTHPARTLHGNIALGQVLDWALHGPTRSFNVVVGYFNHQGHELGRRIPSVPAPSDVVEREIADERGRDPNDCTFRLLFGQALTEPASHALRSWYWLCRWRHANARAALSWRNDLIAALDGRLRAGPLPRASELAAFAWPRVAERGGPFFDAVLDAAADRVSQMLQLDTDGVERFEAWRGRFLARGTTTPILDLLLYFVRMRAAIRVDATPDISSFHPKMYVIERCADGGRREDTIVIAGSGNWSPGAFGRTPSDLANVEVATVHRIAALGATVWSGGGLEVNRVGLGESLAATATRLFAAGQLLASWDEPSALTPRQLDEYLRLPEAPHEAPSERPPAAADPVRPILRCLIERTLGLGDISGYARYESLFADPNLWGGRRPSQYQLDGSLRLLALLEGSHQRGDSDVARPPERGAFLTDEPGLGKTLIAQMVVAALAAERLRAVHRGKRDKTPLRVTIIAPARIAGRDGRASGGGTGWHAAGQEVRNAVKKALAELRLALPEYVGIDVALLIELLDIRVLSTTSFGRHVEKDGKLDAAVVDDWLHVSLSEIVVIDESHNFRNGQAAATRALRFALTLPLPGESWPLLSGEFAKDHGERGVEGTSQPEVISRKVLCLSATPFNNRLEDFVTQVSHFARYQAWCLPAATEGEIFGGLRTALAEWSQALPDRKRRSVFETLVAAVANHLESSRRLDEDEPKAEKREQREKARARPADEGPIYDWEPKYHEFRRSFAQVSEWLQSYVQGRSTPEDESDARARVDALLARLVVQRSRRRILGMMRHEGTLANSFRAPDLPRHPLAIGIDADSGKPTFEAKVLAKLYDLLPTGGQSSPSEERNVGSDRLNLFSYEIGVRRGRDESRVGGTDETAVRNAVGFQAVGLIKRLQSSPYAYLRTLARGPLRRALFEFAVVEALAIEATEHEGMLPARVAESAKGVASLGERLRRQWGSRGEAIAGLLGGTWRPTSPDFFRALVDIDSFDQRARFEKAVALGRRALEGSPTKRKAAGDAPRWLELLLSDIVSNPSKLWTDVEVSLDWILEGGDAGESEALLRSLYLHLEDRHVGLPMDRLRAAIDHDETYVEPVAKWLQGRLKADRRAGWLIALLVALSAMDLANRKRGADDRLGPGGTKMLLFTEYADTQGYLLALAAALLRTANEASARRLHEIVLNDVAGLVAAVKEQSERIAASGSHARAFRSPFDAEWILGWVRSARVDPSVLREAIEHSCSTLAWASSSGAGFLDERREVPPEDGSSVEPTEGDEVDEGLPLGDDPILDAFSPWYQISPDPSQPERATQARARMLSSIRRPARTLIATEILAEGVNLQECGIVAHYDLPWNPTRLIQRNGRVDRRLDPRFEEAERRRALCEALRLPVAAADLYDPPRQIYHLTVLPIEPAFGDESEDPPAERVRRVLTRKLKSIRVLFGLASWPVVLRAADAQRVLTGELEFETPGFRRRERLFEQWRRLAERSEESPIDAPGGTLVISLDGAWFDRLRLESAGDTAPPWDGVRSAIVQTAPRGRAIHSAVDWQIASKSTDRPVTAITGALLLDDRRLVGWDYRQRRQNDVPRWSFLPMILALARGEEAAGACPLSATDEEGRARVPSSPTSFAEDILSMAIDAALEAPRSAERVESTTPPINDFGPEEAAWLRWYLSRPFESGKLNVREEDSLLASAPPRGRWNLWVVRQ